MRPSGQSVSERLAILTMIGQRLINRHAPDQEATIEAVAPGLDGRVRLSIDAPGDPAEVGWTREALNEHWRPVGRAS